MLQNDRKASILHFSSRESWFIASGAPEVHGTGSRYSPDYIRMWRSPTIWTILVRMNSYTRAWSPPTAFGIRRFWSTFSAESAAVPVPSLKHTRIGYLIDFRTSENTYVGDRRRHIINYFNRTPLLLILRWIRTWICHVLRPLLPAVFEFPKSITNLETRGLNIWRI